MAGFWISIPSLMSAACDEGLSGGEKKRNECFQMAVLEPKLTFWTKPTPGLDIDALRVVAHGVNTLRGPQRRSSW